MCTSVLDGFTACLPTRCHLLLNHTCLHPEFTHYSTKVCPFHLLLPTVSICIASSSTMSSAADYLVAVIGSRGLVEERVDAHIDLLTEKGFLLLDQQTLELTQEQAESLLGQGEMGIEAYTQGPCVALLLRRVDAYSTFNSLREELDYTYGSVSGWMALRDRATFFPSTPVLERMLLVLKPQQPDSLLTEVMKLLVENDFIVLGKEMKMLGVESARSLVGEEASQEEIDYLTSDVSVMMVLEKVGAIQDWALLAGPNDPAEARKYAPHTLRARLSSADSNHPSYQNYVYASESSDQARKDLDLFFPSPFPIERTLAILMPDIVERDQVESCLNHFKSHGFTIQCREQIHVSRQRAELFYQAFKDQPGYDAMTQYFSSGPSVVVLLAKPAAVDTLHKLLGPRDPAVARKERPQSLRAKFGTDAIAIGIHGSADVNTASKEIDEFFPGLPVERVPDLEQLQDMLNAKQNDGSNVRPSPVSNTPNKSMYEVLVEGLTQLCRVKPTGDEAVEYFANWLLKNNPNKPAIVEPEEDEEEEVKEANKVQPTIVPNGVGDDVADSSSGPRRYTWLLGAPGAGVTDVASRLTKELSVEGGGVKSFEHISASSLLATAQSSNTKYGNLIAEYRASHRILPAEVVLDLLSSALASSRSQHVLLSAFPLSLDQSFDFEKRFCSKGSSNKDALRRVIYLDVPNESSSAEIIATRRKRSLDGYRKELASFVEDVQPVLEHYEVFGKLKKIDVTKIEEEQVYQQVKKAVGK